MNIAAKHDDSQQAYNQVADDLYRCLDKWMDANISGQFALAASLDLLAKFTRKALPAEQAERVIRDAVGGMMRNGCIMVDGGRIFLLFNNSKLSE